MPYINMNQRPEICEWVNLWSLEMRLKQNSGSFTMLKDYMVKSTLTYLRSTWGWGQQRLMTRMVRRPVVSTVGAAEATAITLALELLYTHGSCKARCCILIRLDVLLAADWGPRYGKNPLICHIMKLLRALSDKGTCVHICWVRSRCGIKGNEIMDQLAKKILDQHIDPQQ